MCSVYSASFTRQSISASRRLGVGAPNVGLLCTRLCSCSLHNRLRVGNVKFFPRSRPWPMRFTRRNKRRAHHPRDGLPRRAGRLQCRGGPRENLTTSSGAARGLIWSPKHSAQWDQRDPQAFPDLLPGKPAHRGACQRPRRIKSAPQLSITRGYLIDEFINRQSCEGRGLDGWRFRHRSSASSWNKRSIDTVACARAVRPHANRQYASDWNGINL